MSRLDLAGKSAIVTGGTAGIGRSVCTALAEEGVSVTVAARRVQLGQSVVQQLQQLNPGGAHLSIATDVTSRDSVSAMVQKTVQERGKIGTVPSTLDRPGTVVEESKLTQKGDQ